MSVPYISLCHDILCKQKPGVIKQTPILELGGQITCVLISVNIVDLVRTPTLQPPAPGIRSQEDDSLDPVTHRSPSTMSATEDAKIFTDITLPSIDLTPILIFLAIQIAFFLGRRRDCENIAYSLLFHVISKISIQYIQFLDPIGSLVSTLLVVGGLSHFF